MKNRLRYIKIPDKRCGFRNRDELSIVREMKKMQSSINAKKDLIESIEIIYEELYKHKIELEVFIRCKNKEKSIDKGIGYPDIYLKDKEVEKGIFETYVFIDLRQELVDFDSINKVESTYSLTPIPFKDLIDVDLMNYGAKFIFKEEKVRLKIIKKRFIDLM
ncbi:hypothetical protein [Clostridium cylindrosporum]|uniref:Uncharacterized protein n=1 Tax=Clostridium cylindrosporum DSM 605 TaxID=1121307 RepID=A0A0J8D5Y9_CLOCY|nr:hypothetical protein [Clostridium cylindrosporum]KMT21510.1 hypothetical protein CLCY_2c02710 [Clostridium cylindrosporum DSM 605]